MYSVNNIYTEFLLKRIRFGKLLVISGLIVMILLFNSCNNNHKNYINGFPTIDIEFDKNIGYLPLERLDSIDFTTDLYNINVKFINMNSEIVNQPNDLFFSQGIKTNDDNSIRKYITYYDRVKRYTYISIRDFISQGCRYTKILKINPNCSKAFYLQWKGTCEILGGDNFKIHNIINSKTPQIITNLPDFIVKKIFPEFKGSIIYKSYAEIQIDYSYSFNSLEFFNHIKFSD